MKKSVTTLSGIVAALALAAPALAERNAQPSERNGKPNPFVQKGFHPGFVRMNPLLSQGRAAAWD